jgi:polyribonucleotide nucleotidyltransferase
MVHISQLDTQRVNKVEDIVGLGDEITVMVIEVEANGKIRLSRQAVLEGWTAEEAVERDRAGRNRKSSRNRSSGNRGNRRDRR